MSFSLRVRKMKVNPLLERRQFVVDVLHPECGTPCINDMREQIAKSYKVPDSKCILLFGFGTKFGGGRSRGFGVIYDNIAALKSIERRFRCKRAGISLEDEAEIAKRPTRIAKKDIRTRCRKVRGTEKAKIRGSGSTKK